MRSVDNRRWEACKEVCCECPSWMAWHEPCEHNQDSHKQACNKNQTNTYITGHYFIVNGDDKTINQKYTTQNVKMGH